MSRAELPPLAEGQSVYLADLTRAEAAALNRSRLVGVQPEADGWRVTAAYTVGAVTVGDLTARVTPKVGAAKALTLLARAHGVKGLKVDPSLVDVAADADLSAVLAVLFAEEAADAMAAGPLRGYRAEDQTLPVLRGRLRMRDQYLRRYGVLAPLEVTVDEWTLDTDENRRIRVACLRLLALDAMPPRTRVALLRLDRMLTEARLPPRGTRLEPWTPTRLNVRLHRLLHLSDLVLAHASVEQDAGSTRTRGFTVNMEWVFEKLVAQLLGELPSGVVTQQNLWLDTRDRLKIRPDMVFYQGGRAVAVADTKYALVEDDGKPPNENAYQVMAYCARLGISTGHLLYAGGAPLAEPFDVVGAGVRFVVHAIDLRREVADIEDQVAEVMRSILGHGSGRAPSGMTAWTA